MRPLAVALITITLAGCAVPRRRSPAPDDRETWTTQHERARQTRRLGIAGLVVGGAIAVAGGALMLHGSHLRGLEATADTEGGLGEIIGGLVVFGAGFGITVGGGATTIQTTLEMREAERRLARLPPGP